jgi:hypothetical protein
MSTVLLKNDDDNDPTYVRVWYFKGPYGYISASETYSTTSAIYIYKGNTFCAGYSGDSRSILGNSAGLYFAVSKNTIGKDPAQDLHLSVPMFTYKHGANSAGSGIGLEDSGYGLIFTLVTNGEMFNSLVYDTYNKYFAMYADDLFINANSNDLVTCGALFTESGGSTLGFSSSDTTATSSYVYAVFSDSNGSFDFSNAYEYYATNQYLAAAHNLSSEYLASYPPLFYMTKNSSYSMSSDEHLVYNDIGTKGWVNPNYIRNVQSGQLKSNVDIGSLFGNKNWYCTSTSTLMVWDGSTTYSPFSESF